MIFGHSRLVGPRPLLTMPKALAPRSRASVHASATSVAVHHRVRVDACVEVAALGAELAILAAIAEFCRQNAAKRDAVAVEVTAHLVGRVEQVVHRFPAEGEQVAGFVARQFAAVDDPAA